MIAPTALIADDEAPLRRYLRGKLAALWPELRICAEAANGEDALALLAEHRPQLAFLDIRMPGPTGLEVAARTPVPCRFVFITAYAEYAVAAFEQEAVDYLLKPVTDARLQETVSRLKRKLADPPPDLSAILEGLRRAIDPAPAFLHWIKVGEGDEIRLIAPEDVLYFQAQDKYTRVVTREQEWVIRVPIKSLEESLDPQAFWRVHRNTLVRVQAIERVTRDFRGQYLLSLRGGKEPLAVSRNYAHLFKQM
jgi:DNA-binding LytR/AlgR family response regulator